MGTATGMGFWQVSIDVPLPIPMQNTIQYHLSFLKQQLSIKSQFMLMLVDNLNIELYSGPFGTAMRQSNGSGTLTLYVLHFIIFIPSWLCK